VTAPGTGAALAAQIGRLNLAPADRRTRLAQPAALLAATRPRQWTKSLLVLAAPVAGGALLRPAVLPAAALALLAFTLAAAAVYLVNDVGDRTRDRLHPVKRHRPVASGQLSPATALAAAAVLAALAVGAPLGAMRPGLGGVITVYLLLSLLYGRWLKNTPWVELAVVATGFVLRPLAGAIGTGVPPSGWFLLVCGCGSLTVAFGKRAAELRQCGPQAALARPVLASYRVSALRTGRRAASAGAVVAYLGWAATRTTPLERWTALLSTLPLTAAFLRYAVCNDRGLGEAPEELALTDRTLQLLGVCWLVTFLVGVCGG